RKTLCPMATGQQDLPIDLFHELNPDGIQTFHSFFGFKSYFITFGNFLFQSICMDKNALLGVLVFDKAVTFGGVEKSYSAFPEKIFWIRSLLSGDADLDILCFNFVFLGGICRCSGNIAISVYIGKHIFYAFAFI